MTSIAHFVGLDVHKDSISIAFAEDGRSAATSLGSIRNDGIRLLKKLDRLGPRDQIHCCYEAGPTGYGLQRYLKRVGIRCDVVAPSLTPDRQGDRVKTDKRDAIKLAHYLRSGDLTPVWVPDEATEALRDLFRARDDAKVAERAARHRLSKFLLRHGRIYPKPTPWTGMHLDWIRKQSFEHEPQNRVLREYLHTVEQNTESVARLMSAIEELVRGSSIEPLVQSLQVLKGVRLLTATGLAVEIGDLHRFPTARDFMSFIGLGIAEDSTGKKRRQFAITKAGNGNVRRLLVEAGWAYRHPPRIGAQLKKRSEGVAPNIQAIGWKAQHRLNHRFRRLVARRKPTQVAIVAVARELAGFVWAIGQQVKLQANGSFSTNASS
jgi:transposase